MSKTTIANIRIRHVLHVLALIVACLLSLPPNTAINATPRQRPSQAAPPQALLPAIPADEHWDDRFASSGFEHEVTALAFDSIGRVFAAVEIPEDRIITRIFRWDGIRWTPLGQDINGLVYTLAIDEAEALYAGGDFASAGAQVAANVARWDGQHWRPLGAGLNLAVLALTTDGRGGLYAGGEFTESGGRAAKYVAYWDGTAWSSLGTGLTGDFDESGSEVGGVSALLADGKGGVYVGGMFTKVGEVTANNIARWNGSRWAPLGQGSAGEVLAMTVDRNDYLYAGGSFPMAEGQAASVARWNGQGWLPIQGGPWGTVQALQVDDQGTLYAGGRFFDAARQPANPIARWSDGTWSALGNGLTDTQYESKRAVGDRSPTARFDHQETPPYPIVHRPLNDPALHVGLQRIAATIGYELI